MNESYWTKSITLEQNPPVAPGRSYLTAAVIHRGVFHNDVDIIPNVERRLESIFTLRKIGSSVKKEVLGYQSDFF